MYRMIHMKRDIDYKKAYYQQYNLEKKSIARSLNTKVLYVIAANIGIAILVCAWVMLLSYLMNKDRDELSQFVTSSPEAMRYAEIKIIEPEFFNVRNYNAMVNTAQSAIENRPFCEKKAYDIIKKNLSGGMTLLKIQYEEDYLLALIGLNNINEIPEYVQKVKSNSIFRSVSYNGWTDDSPTEQFEYCFIIKCTLERDGEIE